MHGLRTFLASAFIVAVAAGGGPTLAAPPDLKFRPTLVAVPLQLVPQAPAAPSPTAVSVSIDITVEFECDLRPRDAEATFTLQFVSERGVATPVTFVPTTWEDGVRGMRFYAFAAHVTLAPGRYTLSSDAGLARASIAVIRTYGADAYGYYASTRDCQEARPDATSPLRQVLRRAVLSLLAPPDPDAPQSSRLLTAPLVVGGAGRATPWIHLSARITRAE